MLTQLCEFLEHLKVKFWENLNGYFRIYLKERFFLIGHLNEHVGSVARDIDGVNYGHVFGVVNTKSKSIMDFSWIFYFIIVNTCHRKREYYLINI